MHCIYYNNIIITRPVAAVSVQTNSISNIVECITILYGNIIFELRRYSVIIDATIMCKILKK